MVRARRAGRRRPMRSAAVGLLAIVVMAGGCTEPRHDQPAASAPASTTTAPAPPGGATPAIAPRPAPVVAALPRSPVRPDNRPTAVAGETNGEMPDSALVDVAPDCRADRAAAPSLGLLLRTARDAGVALSTNECYRSLTGQVQAQQNATAKGNSACAASVPKTTSGTPKGTSMHGWGKAADLEFGADGAAFLDATASRFGWNHPGWARPGGGPCPEPWHWEWVGDGGVLGLAPVRADVVALVASADTAGYATVTALGAVEARGDAVAGPAEPPAVPALVAGGARSGAGYLLATWDGAVIPVGSARAPAAPSAGTSASPVVALASTGDGTGYWTVTADGHVTAGGSAAPFGAPADAGVALPHPVVGIASTPSGRGYWIATADGHVDGFGDAPTHGDASGASIPAPIVAIAATPSGHGYWLVGADGSVYPFGDATGAGELSGSPLVQPVVAIASTASGRGYWLAAADGGVFAFGDAAFLGAG